MPPLHTWQVEWARAQQLGQQPVEAVGHSVALAAGAGGGSSCCGCASTRRCRATSRAVAGGLLRGSGQLLLALAEACTLVRVEQAANRWRRWTAATAAQRPSVRDARYARYAPVNAARCYAG